MNPNYPLPGLALGGLLGGTTHAFLDAITHRDIHPFRPLALANPLLGLIGWDLLHTACVAAGATGVLTLVLRVRLWRAAA